MTAHRRAAIGVLLIVLATPAAAQLPISRTLLWDQADLLSAPIADFVVQQDTTSAVHVNPATCQQVAPFTCSTPITIATLGAHTFTVTAINAWGLWTSTALTVNIAAPGKSGNLRIK